jgi:acyl-CoA reductase-like NAD-dependent aldehyde dehydrogenase
MHRRFLLMSLPGMTSWEEEVFGPVASICKASTVEEAIALANQNEFGLSAVVYGDDHGRM